MSAGAHSVTVPPRYERAARAPRAAPSELIRGLLRVAGFAALGLYGVSRWARLTSPAPTGRLLGLLGLAVLVVMVVPLVDRIGRPPALVAAFCLGLLALPLAGLPWQDFVHLRIALSARHIADGLGGLPAAVVPYSGASHWVRTVVTLGAAVLLIDAAVVLAFAPAALGELRRAGAALALLAFAVIPATLVRPELPYLQGLALFALLAFFLWGDRLRRETLGAALAIAALAGVAGAVLAPRLDQHHALVNYRAWAGTLPHAHVDAFQWNQTYGPLHWPRKGHVVLRVEARTGDYWKAENLDVFNGAAWVAGAVARQQLPPPDPQAIDTWSQTIKVSIDGMRTPDVIASGYASGPIGVPGGTVSGQSAGTWSAPHELGPGASYVVNTYAPQPSAAQLTAAGAGYPRHLLDDYRAMRLPETGVRPAAEPALVFPRFHTHAPIQFTGRGVRGRTAAAAALARSPYASVYALARQLAAGARTPYALAAHIERFLGRGYTYNESPPVRAFPLVSFLMHDRIGYCQQFSGAMALLLRMGGVPARVATGFTTGSRQGQGGPFVVTDIDAHAWVEAWFAHYGWVRFDPTPAVAPARGGASALPVVKNLPGASFGANPSSRHQFQVGDVAARAGRRGRGGALSAVSIVILALLAGLLALTLVWRRSHAGVEDRLQELERALARTGRPLAGGVTLAELEHRFRGSPAVAAYIRGLRLERYGGGASPAVPGARRALRGQLGIGLGLRGRLRAIWALPPTVALAPRVRAGPAEKPGARS